MYCRNLCTRYKVVRPARGSPYLIGLKRCIHCKIYMMFEGTRCPCCSVRLRTRPHNTRSKEKILTEIRRIWWIEIEIETKAVMSCPVVIVMTSNLKVKGKMASLTENRRLSWEMIVWPSIFYDRRVSGQKRLRIWKIRNTDLQN